MIMSNREGSFPKPNEGLLIEKDGMDTRLMSMTE